MALHVVQSAVVLDGAESVRAHSLASAGEDMEMEYFWIWGTKKVYVCPKGIPVHGGNPSACSKKHNNEARAKGTGGMIDEKALTIVAVMKQVVFSHDLLVEGR